MTSETAFLTVACQWAPKFRRLKVVHTGPAVEDVPTAAAQYTSEYICTAQGDTCLSPSVSASSLCVHKCAIGLQQFVGVLKTKTFRKFILLPSCGERSANSSSVELPRQSRLRPQPGSVPSHYVVKLASIVSRLMNTATEKPRRQLGHFEHDSCVTRWPIRPTLYFLFWIIVGTFL
jgi:hypothetical protein